MGFRDAGLAGEKRKLWFKSGASIMLDVFFPPGL